MPKKKPEMGQFFENEKYRIEIKYSPEAVEKELIKIKLKDSDTVEFSSGQLIEIISKNLKNKEMALALSEYELETKTISTINVVRTFEFVANQDYKKGDKVAFNFEQPYPFFIALLEEAYGLAKTKGEVVSVPMSIMDEAKESMMKKNKDLAEAINQPTLNKLNIKTK